MSQERKVVLEEQDFAALACLVYFHQAFLPAVDYDSKVSKNTTTTVLLGNGDEHHRDEVDSSFPAPSQEELYFVPESLIDTSASMEQIMEDRRFSLLALQSDIEAAEQSEQEKHKLAQKLLVTIGSLLQDANRELSALQDNNLLGAAIVRGCKELADVASTVAENLGHDQLMLAEASLRDFSDSTDLRLQPELDNKNYQLMRSSSRSAGINHQQEIAVLVDLLHDIEYSLRAIEEEEATEIADLAVSVALVFVQSLQHAHSQLIPSDLLLHHSTTNSNRKFNDFPRIQAVDEDASFDEENPPPPSPITRPNPPRIRCLWPPLAPMAAEFLHRTKEELSQRHHWAVSTAVTLALWPVAMTAAMWSVPALAMDHVLQQAYGHFENSPVIVSAEVGAAQAQRTAQLVLKTTLALAKPTLRVAKRQVQKHGPDLIAAAKQKALHPLSTIHEVVDGTMWCAGQVFSFCGEQWHRWQHDTDASESLL